MSEYTYNILCEEASHVEKTTDHCGICWAIEQAYQRGRFDAAEAVAKAPTKGNNNVWMLRANAIVAAKEK